MHSDDHVLSKVPEVTLGFWVIKILATTLGETGGDSVTMSWLHADQNAHNGGYLVGTGIFLALFIAAVIGQIAVSRFNRWVYWLAIVASTTVGTAMADFFDRSLLGALYYWTTISRVFLFWAAFILTRPLGATVGDFLDKPTSDGGLALSRPLASAVILALIVVLVVVLPQRPGRHPGSGLAAQPQ
jgi:uncharacterized membrane-anchored protein